MTQLRLYVGDNLSILRAKKNKWKGKFRVAFCDPPYNLGASTKATISKSVIRNPHDDPLLAKGIQLYKGSWDEMDQPKFIAYTRDWLKAIVPLLKPDGTIFVCGFFNFNLWITRMIAEEEKWKNINMIYVERPNATPNIRGIRLQAVVEECLWLKPKKKGYFNYWRAKAYAWHDKARNRQMSNLWRIPIDHSEFVGKHTTQKPIEWVRRCLTIASDQGDWVLDPFLGSGTTMLVAKMLQRNCIGIEKEQKFVPDIKAKVGFNETSLMQFTDFGNKVPQGKIVYRIIDKSTKGFLDSPKKKVKSWLSP